MTVERSERFIAAARNLDLFPLLDAEKIKAFRIDYGQQARRGLKNKLRLAVNRKVIFAGHVGTGKSTLLARFAQEMTEAGKFVAFFSIADLVEMSKVDHVYVLYSIALVLMKKAKEESVAMPPLLQKSIDEWFLTTKTKTYSDGLKSEFSAGMELFKMLSAKLHKEDSFREEVKITYSPNVRSLIDKVNEISGIIQASTGKEILVIIDDLDKLTINDARSIYHDNLNNLLAPTIPIILTVPIAIVRDPEISGSLRLLGEPQLLTVPKFYAQDDAHQSDAQPVAENVQILRDLVEKRIDPDLIEEAALDRMVLCSGGLLRELVRLAQQCCEECLSKIEDNPDVEVKIDDEILTVAIKVLRNGFARILGTDDYKILKSVYQDFTPPNTKEPNFLSLLHNLCVLEYENDDLWYDLHPIVVDLLERKKIIDPIT